MMETDNSRVLHDLRTTLTNKFTKSLPIVCCSIPLPLLQVRAVSKYVECLTMLLLIGVLYVLEELTQRMTFLVHHVTAPVELSKPEML